MPYLLNKRLDEFRSVGKYCDVNIQVQGSTFHCHRAVLASISGYFDTSFSEGDFSKSLPKDVVLNNIDAVTFERTLKYMYTEELPAINSSNVEDLMKAGAFLKIDDIVSICENFIKFNVSSITHSQLFQLVGLVYALNVSVKDNLSRYITENLLNLVQQSAFLEIPHETLKILLEYYRSCVPYRREDFLLDGLIRWTFYSCQDRNKYFQDLVKIIDFEKISAEYEEFLLREFEAVDDSDISDKVPLQVKIERRLLEHKFTQDQTQLTVYEDPQFSQSPTIHIFCQNNHKYSTSCGIYSLNQRKVEPKWVCSRKFEKKHHYRCYEINEFITFNNLIYCFEFDDSKDSEFSFHAYSSLEFFLESPKILAPFPLLRAGNIVPGYYTKLCGFCNDSIYLYSNAIARFSKVQMKNFNEEEYGRNFYVYNLHQDEWLPVTPMKRTVIDACLIADNELVYLIGGKDKTYYSVDENIEGFAQAYDPRSQTWIILPKTNFFHSKHSSGCNLNGKIYIWNGEFIEVYNAGERKWEATKCRFQQNKGQCKKILLPYNNQLYLFDFYIRKFYTYNPVSQEFSSLISFASIFNDANGDNFSSYIKDIIVFKSF